MGSGRASVLELLSLGPGRGFAGRGDEAPYRYSRVYAEMNSCPRVRSAFCLPKECQPSVTGRAVGRYDSASPRAAS